MTENPFVRLLFKIAYHKGIVIIFDAHTLLFSYRNKQRNKLYNIKRSMAVNHGIKSTLFKIKCKLILFSTLEPLTSYVSKYVVSFF
jgi:hypothetical protein